MPRMLHIIYALYIPAPNIFSWEQFKWVSYKVCGSFDDRASLLLNLGTWIVCPTRYVTCISAEVQSQLHVTTCGRTGPTCLWQYMLCSEYIFLYNPLLPIKWKKNSIDVSFVTLPNWMFVSINCTGSSWWSWYNGHGAKGWGIILFCLLILTSSLWVQKCVHVHSSSI